ncbi:hypothetical protein FA09DRAFT_361575 [Tilletiopsis washingtonensis]|uniref:non-specific serine/threonine protein kinase n=1 Tax=Tilletiopsis washingtonensis TaxID=58919 RepID=A0A316Z7B4_9BASI|nr:hypothetical protein FA09DRAFT_361575 [Tilletiopsis washingtonensis]PWN96842.1 hypothetical protein FA09DRAFT_361575 [Tilletiopsis washingtonensis]
MSSLSPLSPAPSSDAAAGHSDSPPASASASTHSLALATALQRAGLPEASRNRAGLLSRAPSESDPHLPGGSRHSQHEEHLLLYDEEDGYTDGSGRDEDLPRRFAQSAQQQAGTASASTSSSPQTPLAAALGPRAQRGDAEPGGGRRSSSATGSRLAELHARSSSTGDSAESSLHSGSGYSGGPSSSSGSARGGAGDTAAPTPHSGRSSFSVPSAPTSAASSISGGHRGDGRAGSSARVWAQQASSSRSGHRSGDVSEDGGASLGRAKSVSSVSSVNSTSSIEALPFRAAPLGNTRVGFGGYGGMGGSRNGGMGSGGGGGGGWPTRRDADAAAMPVFSSPNNDTTPRAGGGSAVFDASMSPLTRARILPKAPSDAWLYRNAPGMGGGRDGRPIPGSAPPPQAQSIAAEHLRHLQAAGAGGSGGFLGDGSGSMPSTSPTRTRAGAAIRSKLARSAGKLGLKPLTSMPLGAVAPASLPIGTAVPFSPGALGVEEDYPLQPLLADMSGLGLGDVGVRTSSVTNAPLVVPKHPPGPPGTGPLPSPGLTGAAASNGGSPGFLLSGPSPRVSPHALERDEDVLSRRGAAIGVPSPPGSTVDSSALSTTASPRATSPSPAAQVARTGSPNLVGTSSSRRPSSSNVHSLLAAVGGNASGAFSSSSRGSSSSMLSQGPTPAQQVQLDAEAGIARAPAEPSGDTPGPSPVSPSSSPVYQPQRGSGVFLTAAARAARFGGLASNNPSAPSSRAASDYGGKGEASAASSSAGNSGGSAPPIVQSAARRPRLLRALTSEGAMSHHSRSSEGSSEPESPNSLSPVSPGGASGAAPPRPRSWRRGGKGSDEPGSTSRFRSALANTLGTRSPSPRLPASPEVPHESLDGVSRAPLNPFAAPRITPTLDEGPLGEPLQGSPRTAPHRPSLQPSYPSTAVSLNSTSTAAISMRAPQRVVASQVEPPTFALDSPSLSTPASSLAPPSSLAQAGAPSLSPTREVTSPMPESAASPSDQATVLPSSVETAVPLPPPAAAAAPSRTARGRDDFEFGEVLGEGSYSTVIEAWDLLSAPRALDAPKPLSANAAIAGAGSAARSAAARNEGRKAYAVKVLDKVHILKEKKQKYVSVEKEALSLLLRHPGVITLFWTFQDRDSLYFVLELAPNGELLSFIKRFGSFDSASARHYAAQLVDTIASMHAVGVVHRDIKPENVLLDGNMRIKVADFGSAKITRKKSGAAAAAPTTVPSEAEPQRASSFVGTAEYVSPELLTEKAATEASDWWAFGCVLYQMIAGRPPFKGPNEYQTFQRIIRRDFDYPDAFPADARELVDRLLVLDPMQRLGTGAEGVAEIKAHPFFKGVDWARLWTLEVPPISTGIFQRPRPAAAPEGSTPFDRFGRDAWVEDALASSDEDGDEASGDVSLSGDASHDEASLPPSSAASQARGGAEADDDDSSSSDGPPAPRRRGLSQNGGTGSRRGSHILRVAASIAGIADSARGRSASQQQQQAALGRPVALRHLQNRFSTASMNTSSSSLNNNASEFDTPSGGSRTPAAQLQATSWAALLLPHEALLYACPITQRKAGAFRSTSKRRQLLLTDFPRLLCVKETQDQLLVKSEVILGIPTAASSAASRTASPQHEARNSLRPQTSQDMLRQTSAGPTLGGAETSEPLAASPRLRAVRRDSLPAAASPQLAAGVLDRAPNFMTGIEAKGTRGFVVHTPARSYTYEDPGGDASYWLRSITAAAARGR